MIQEPISEDDGASVACSTKRQQYRLTAAALGQRQDLATKRRWFKDLDELKYKLSLKADDSRLLGEIETSLLKVFSFKDIAEIFRPEYHEVYEGDERTLETQARIRELELKLSQQQQQLIDAQQREKSSAAVPDAADMVPKAKYDKLLKVIYSQKDKIYDLESCLGLCKICTARQCFHYLRPKPQATGNATQK